MQRKQIAISWDMIGKRVKHKSFGLGTITDIYSTSVGITFDKVGKKNIGYEFCIKNKLLELSEEIQ